jgi:hypothetical protein
MMLTRKIAACLFLCLLVVVGSAQNSYADSAEVLPKGIFRGNVEYSYYFPIDEKFDPDGNVENIAKDYNTSMNSGLFSSLKRLEVGFGMPDGSASIGNSEVDFKYNVDEVELKFFYGLTDKLSIGTKIPYFWYKNNVNAGVNASNATIGFNPYFDQPGDPYGIPLIPTQLGGVKNDRLATELVQNTLVHDYGYKRIASWSDQGIGDIEVGGRYQYLQTQNWRLSFTGALRLPTGEVNDPDNLVDIGFGSGAWALLFRSNNDFTAFENFVLNASLEYDLVLPDHETLRVPDDVNNPITNNKEDVSRDLGDIYKLKLSGAYGLPRGFGIELFYSYAFKTKDSVSGDQGFAYESLEDETNWSYQEYKIGLSYSTFPLFQEKKFPLPLVFGVEFEDVFAGTNNFLKQRLLTISLSAFF